MKCEVPGCTNLPVTHFLKVTDRQVKSEEAYCEWHAYYQNPFTIDARLSDCSKINYVRVDLAYLVALEVPNQSFLGLRDNEARRNIAFEIGTQETQYMWHILKGTVGPRPFFCHVAANIVRALNANVSRILIQGTGTAGVLQANIELLIGPTTINIDSRPSDAISLAIVTGAEIFIDEALLREWHPPSEGGAAKSTEGWSRLGAGRLG
jgi:bifunctional DNase/RNase